MVKTTIRSIAKECIRHYTSAVKSSKGIKSMCLCEVKSVVIICTVRCIIRKSVGEGGVSREQLGSRYRVRFKEDVGHWRGNIKVFPERS